MKTYEKELINYNNLNNIAKRNCVVLFGSSFLKNIPVSELIQTFDLDCSMYNRSFTDLSVFDAAKLLNECVLPLLPRKIMIGLGETDLERGYKTIPEIIEVYGELINTIRSADKHCKIAVVSVCSNSGDLKPEELNKELKLLAHKKKCDYADITPSVKSSASGIYAFKMLKVFALDKISFLDAMTMSV